MNIFTTIAMVETMVSAFEQYEPALAKDVQDIVLILNKVRNKLAQSQGQK
jgi:hypothetical protein